MVRYKRNKSAARANLYSSSFFFKFPNPVAMRARRMLATRLVGWGETSHPSNRRQRNGGRAHITPHSRTTGAIRQQPRIAEKCFFFYYYSNKKGEKRSSHRIGCEVMHDGLVSDHLLPHLKTLEIFPAVSLSLLSIIFYYFLNGKFHKGRNNFFR
jgi:hypothetical protein